MTEQRGWAIAVVVAAVAAGVLLALLDPSTWRLAVGYASLVLFVTGWFALGRVCPEDSAGALAFVAIVIVAAAGVTLAHPSLAVIQCIAYPLVWTQLGRWPGIIVANVLLATAVGATMTIGSDGDLVTSVVIESVSLAFSLAFGAWITSIARQSDERRRLLEELRATQVELAALNRDAGVSSERERLAREIHDTIAQDLTGIVLLAQRARREPSAAPELLEVLEESARTALGETRALVAATASPVMEGGIAAALARLGERFERETGIRVVVSVEAGALGRDREVVLIRCAQEALANVRKHAGARSVTLRLTGAADVALEVVDDGRGFDAAAPSSGFGLVGMRERLALVHGSLAVDSGESGTRLRIALPAVAS